MVSLPIKTALLALAMILIQDASWAQQNAYITGPSENQVDSLRQRFSTETSDQLRMGLSRELAFYYTESDPDTALYYLNSQLQLARSLGERVWEGDALWVYSYILYSKGQYTESFTLSSQAITLLTDASSERQVWEPGRLSRIGTPEEARLIALALAYHNQAHLYGQINNIAEQRALYRKAIELMEKTENDAIACLSYGRLGDSYIKDYPDSAMIYIGIALEKGRSAGYGRYRGNQLNYMGIAHEALNNFDSAENYYQEAIADSRIENNSRALTLAYYYLARLNQMNGDTVQALENAHNSYEVAGSIRNLTVVRLAGFLLSMLYEQIGDIEKAYYYLRQSQAASETLQEEDQVRRVSDLQFGEQLRLRDIEELQSRNRTRLQMTVLMGVLFTIAVVAFLLFRNNRQKQKTNKVLETTLSNLKSTQAQLIQSEKMASLGELTAGIAHEIQNPLNFVNNFSEISVELVDEMNEELEKGDIEEAKFIGKDLKENLSKINHHGKRAGAIVKGMLEHSRANSGEKTPTDLNALTDEFVRLSYHGLRAKDKSLPDGQAGFNADFQLELDPDLPKVNVVASDIGRVILNLVNNAFYAVNEKSKMVVVETHGRASQQTPPSYKPTVTVSTKNLGDRIEISVKDNGNGIPEEIKDKIFQPFFTTKPTGQGTGLGLSLAYDIVKAHGGELKVETKEDHPSALTGKDRDDPRLNNSVGREEGTVFIIQLPIII